MRRHRCGRTYGPWCGFAGRSAGCRAPRCRSLEVQAHRRLLANLAVSRCGACGVCSREDCQISVQGSGYGAELVSVVLARAPFGSRQRTMATGAFVFRHAGSCFDEYVSAVPLVRRDTHSPAFLRCHTDGIEELVQACFHGWCRNSEIFQNVRGLVGRYFTSHNQLLVCGILEQTQRQE